MHCKPNKYTLTSYYPFGMTMPGRNANPTTYRHGFNGMEKDDEVSGNGNSYTATFWQYDPRLGRRWNVDPIIKIDQSVYSCFSNNPIWLIDPSGADTLQFGDDNKYVKTIPSEGIDVGMKTGKNGFVFDFADPINDVAAIEAGTITELYIPTKEEMLNDLNNAGVLNADDSDKGNYDGAKYLYNNSNAAVNSGKTDFVVTSKMHGSMEWGGEELGMGYNSNYLYITKVDDKMLAHNNKNYGNFMWGASARSLEVGIGLALAGAHLNNYLNDVHNSDKRWWQRDIDTKDDQFSITSGYLWFHDYTKGK